MSDELAHGSTLGMTPSDQAATSSEIEIGSRLGRFRVTSRLGAGGMGVVMAGEDIELGRPVAIKVVRGDVDQPGYRERLMREAQAMARLEHPNVVRVYEVGSDRGRLFIAMELVDGVTLTKWLEAERPWRDVVVLFLQVGEGLAAVHRVGLVHRDFKPDNVLVDRKGVARVADFGLARVDDKSQPQLTRTGVMMGTPAFMAPEQQWGSDVDARADQYSFCVALREATKRHADLPRRVKDAIARGLSYDADERFPSMTELLSAVRGKVRVRGPWILAAVGAAIVASGAAAAAVVLSHRVVEDRIVPVNAPLVMIGTVTIDAAAVEEPPSPETTMAVAVPPPVAPPVTRVTTPPTPVKGPGLGSYVAPGTGSAAKPKTVATSSPPPPSSPPVPKSKVVRHEIDAAHRVAVRVAVHDLGYGGLTFTGDPSNDEQLARDAIAKLGPDDDLQRGAAIYALGAVQRRESHCDKALATWSSAFEVLGKANEKDRHDNNVWRFWVRTKFAMALCMLEQGRGVDAWALLDGEVRRTSFGFTDAERSAFHFVAGMAGWETGDPEARHEAVMGFGYGPRKQLDQTINNWARVVGFQP